jgi:DNA-binding transcriptional MerR regulator
MRISELSRTSGVSIPTIKFYLREGLLPPGRLTAANQASYADEHVRRLRLVRVLADVGGLSVAAIGRVLRAIDDERVPPTRMMGIAHHALGPAPDRAAPPPDVEAARDDIDRWLTERGWQVTSDAPARRALADALVALRRLGRDVGPETFDPYAEIADRLAAFELDAIGGQRTRAEAVESVIVGTVIYEAALVALRRLAHEHQAQLRQAAG